MRYLLHHTEIKDYLEQEKLESLKKAFFYFFKKAVVQKRKEEQEKLKSLKKAVEQKRKEALVIKKKRLQEAQLEKDVECDHSGLL